MEFAQAREDLTVALRWAARLKLNEGIDNHFSLAVNEAGTRFLVNPYGLHWAEVRASDLIVVDAAKDIVHSPSVEETAYQIHSAIHLFNPRSRCVLHTHMPYATALGLLADGNLKMIEQNAMRFLDRITYVGEYYGLAENRKEAERLARGMIEKPVAFWRGHGVVVTGPTIQVAFDDLYFLERACRLQVLTRSMGGTTINVPDEVVRLTAKQMTASDKWANLHFEALRRLLDREEPDYRDQGPCESKK